MSAFPTPPTGRDTPAVGQRWEVAPCVRDLVHPGRTVGGLPRRCAAGVRFESLSLASHQTWRSLHPGAGAGKGIFRRALPRFAGNDLSSTLTVVGSLLGYTGRSFWRYSVVCGRDVRPAHVVSRADAQRHLQPGLVRQPPPGRRHRLVRLRGGATRGRLQIPLWPVPLGGSSRAPGDPRQWNWCNNIPTN